MFVLSIVFALFCAYLCHCQMCSSINHINSTNSILVNSKISSTPFLMADKLGIMQCLNWCLLYSLCKAVNFQNSSGFCDLHNSFATPANVEIDWSYITTNVSSWPSKTIGHCQDHTCGSNTVCETDDDGHLCKVIGCYDSQQQFSNVSTFRKKIYYFEETVDVPCEYDYYTNVTVQCRINGFFTDFQCFPYAQIRNCNQLHSQCNPNLQDGEYWLFPPGLGGSMTKLFRHGMFSNPTAFVTLPLGNFASKSLYVYVSPTNCSVELAPPTFRDANMLGYTTFERIAIAPASGGLMNHLTFTESNFTQQNFGEASDSVPETSTCIALGQFKIDLTGTGLILKVVNWAGDLPTTTMEISNDYNRVITGVCGKGGNGCASVSGITFSPDADPLQRPPLDSAVRPICVL